MTRRIVVHIDRLTLTGFAREDRQVIAAGLRHRRVFSHSPLVVLQHGLEQRPFVVEAGVPQHDRRFA